MKMPTSQGTAHSNERGVGGPWIRNNLTLVGRRQRLGRSQFVHVRNHICTRGELQETRRRKCGEHRVCSPHVYTRPCPAQRSAAQNVGVNGGPEASGWARKHSFPDLLRTLARYRSLGREGLFTALFQVPVGASDQVEIKTLCFGRSCRELICTKCRCFFLAHFHEFFGSPVSILTPQKNDDAIVSRRCQGGGQTMDGTSLVFQ